MLHGGYMMMEANEGTFHKLNGSRDDTIYICIVEYMNILLPIVEYVINSLLANTNVQQSITWITEAYKCIATSQQPARASHLPLLEGTRIVRLDGGCVWVCEWAHDWLQNINYKRQHFALRVCLYCRNMCDCAAEWPQAISPVSMCNLIMSSVAVISYTHENWPLFALRYGKRHNCVSTSIVCAPHLRLDGGRRERPSNIETRCLGSANATRQ